MIHGMMMSAAGAASGPAPASWPPIESLNAATGTNFNGGSNRLGLINCFGKWLNVFKQSTDGVTWTTVTGTPVNATAFQAFNGSSLALCFYSSVLYSTTNATAWTATTGNFATIWGTIAGGGPQTMIYAAGKWVVFGNATTTAARCVYSTDGVTWTLSTSFATATGTVGASAATCVPVYSAAAGKYFFCASNWKIYSSPDAVTWTRVTTVTASTGTPAAMMVNTAGDTLVMVSTSAKYWISTNNGVTWGATGATIHASLTSLTNGRWMGDKFVVVGANRKMARSTNGSTWTYFDAGAISGSETTQTLYGMANTSNDPGTNTYLFISPSAVRHMATG